jgi:hypothetical protein
VNEAGPLDPEEVATFRPWLPSVAFAPTATIAVKEVALVTLTWLTESPASSAETLVLPGWVSKLVPVKVTVTLAPLTPLEGLIDVRVGGGATGMVTANGTGPLVPPSFATVMLRLPGAASEAIVKLAVIDVSLPTVTELTVIPAPLTDTKAVAFWHAAFAPAANPVPVNVTVICAP